MGARTPISVALLLIMMLGQTRLVGMIFLFLLSTYAIELGYNLLKGAEYIVSLYTGNVVTEEYNVMFNSGEFNWYHAIDEVSHKAKSL
jgi:hypothetical protein